MTTHVSGAAVLDAEMVSSMAAKLEQTPRLWLPLPVRRAGDGWLIEVRAGRATKVVTAHVGPARVDGGDVRRRLSWTVLTEDGVTPHPGLPSFDGSIQVRTAPAAVLVVSGRYAPPVGALGRALDALMLSHVARHTVTSLAQDVAARLAEPHDTAAPLIGRR